MREEASRQEEIGTERASIGNAGALVGSPQTSGRLETVPLNPGIEIKLHPEFQ